MRYVDSNVFIYPVVASEKTERKAALSKSILLKIATGQLEAATASLTWDELVWAVGKIFSRRRAVTQGKKLLEFPNLKILGIDGATIRSAQSLIEKYDVKPRDSIHAACALEDGIREIISDDPDFDKIRELKRLELHVT